MAKALITKSLDYSIRLSDSIDITEIENTELSLDGEQVKKERELSDYTSEIDSCSRIQKLLKAVECKKHHILQMIRFNEIKKLLIDSKLIDSNGKPGRLGKQLINYQRNDIEYTELCVSVLSELLKSSEESSITITEVIRVFVTKNMSVITVNEGMHQTDDKLKYFLEQLGILGKTEELRSQNLKINGKIITESGKEILRQLYDKKNSMNNKKQPISINFFNKSKILSDNFHFGLNKWRIKINNFTRNYHINIKVTIIIFVFLLIMLFALLLKWDIKIFPFN